MEDRISFCLIYRQSGQGVLAVRYFELYYAVAQLQWMAQWLIDMRQEELGSLREALNEGSLIAVVLGMYLCKRYVRQLHGLLKSHSVGILLLTLLPKEIYEARPYINETDPQLMS
ncbi:hypothetical protein NDU88_005376 [Pleurodeles waltl]|uniref:Uncharacterized protein n=1 Tax=Pleurodeles waltl TaxID=8319 RepID=A0AAV7WBS8_PLEWA|nr:hypothetical protein NDU88_005376 [Pleurodeles waltl]